QTGLVERASSRRLIVSTPSKGQLAAGMSRALTMHQVTFMELWGAMITVEPAIAEAAATNISPDDLAQLETNLEEARDVVANAKRSIELDEQFHEVIGDASGNRVLQLAREPINLMFNPAVSKVMTQLSQATARNLEAHEHILAALKQRDPGETRRWMQKHIDDLKRGYEHAGFDLHGPVQVSRA
ncbi:MAG: FCD domain-containing protein, partial [Pseudomonadota bacterium]